MATRFLAKKGLVEADLPAEEGPRPLQIALGELDAPGGQSATVLSALRRAFSGRPLSVLNVPSPMQALLDNEVRIAVVSTADFYELGEGIFPVQREGMQAVGVVGHDTVHLLVRADSDIASIMDATRIGVAHAGGASQHVARMVLAALGHSEARLVPVPEGSDSPISIQLEALQRGEIDLALFMVETGHPRIMRAMQSGEFRLIGLPEWQQGNSLIRFPFLRLARLNTDAYANMDRPVDTIGAQVVLAGPVPSADPIGAAGPGTAAIGEVLPLTNNRVTALNEALSSDEAIDPAVPATPVLAPKPKPEPASINPSSAYSLINFLAICLAIYFVYLYARKEPVRSQRKRARKSGGG